MLARAKYTEAIEALEESISMWIQLGSEEDRNAVYAGQLLDMARQKLKESQETSPE